MPIRAALIVMILLGAYAGLPEELLAEEKASKDSVQTSVSNTHAKQGQGDNNNEAAKPDAQNDEGVAIIDPFKEAEHFDRAYELFFKKDDNHAALEEINKAIKLYDKKGRFFALRGFIYNELARLEWLRSNYDESRHYERKALPDFNRCMELAKGDNNAAFTACALEKAKLLCDSGLNSAKSKGPNTKEGFEIANSYLSSRTSDTLPFVFTNPQVQVDFLMARSKCYELSENKKKAHADVRSACDKCKAISGCHQHPCYVAALNSRAEDRRLFVDTWASFGSYDCLYNKKTISRRSDRDVKVWVKYLVPVPDVDDKGVFPGDTNAHEMFLYRVDCLNREFAVEQYMKYDNRGKRVSDEINNPNEVRRAIEPDSYEEQLADEICKVPSSDKDRKQKKGKVRDKTKKKPGDKDA